MILSLAQSKEFKKNPSINPLTGRKIAHEKATYNALVKACEKLNINDKGEGVDNNKNTDKKVDEITDDINKISLLGIEPIPMTRKQIKKQMPDKIIEKRARKHYPNFSASQKIILKSIYGNNLRRLGFSTAKKIIGKKFYGLNRKISFKELLSHDNREKNIVSYKLTQFNVTEENEEYFDVNVANEDKIQIEPCSNKNAYNSSSLPFYVFIDY